MLQRRWIVEPEQFASNRGVLFLTPAVSALLVKMALFHHCDLGK